MRPARGLDALPRDPAAAAREPPGDRCPDDFSLTDAPKRGHGGDGVADLRRVAREDEAGVRNPLAYTRAGLDGLVKLASEGSEFDRGGYLYIIARLPEEVLAHTLAEAVCVLSEEGWSLMTSSHEYADEAEE